MAVAAGVGAAAGAVVFVLGAAVADGEAFGFGVGVGEGAEEGVRFALTVGVGRAVLGVGDGAADGGCGVDEGCGVDGAAEVVSLDATGVLGEFERPKK